MAGYRIFSAGDQSIGVEFGNYISEKTNNKVREFCSNFSKWKRKGILDIVPTYRSVLITFDSRQISAEKVKKRVKHCAEEEGIVSQKKRIVEIPVCYGGKFGPDLEDVSEYTGFSEEEIIKRHSEKEYRIYMLGFLPGFPYLGGMDEALSIPRLEEPRVKIAAGSVGIAETQTGIYPMESPGGWRLIGRTPVRIYNPTRKETVPYKVGDFIRFVPIEASEYAKIEALDKENCYTYKVYELV